MGWGLVLVPWLGRVTQVDPPQPFGNPYMLESLVMDLPDVFHVKVTSAIAVRISAECAVDKSGKLDRYGGDSAAEDLTIFRSYAIYTCR